MNGLRDEAPEYDQGSVDPVPPGGSSVVKGRENGGIGQKLPKGRQEPSRQIGLKTGENPAEVRVQEASCLPMAFGDTNNIGSGGLLHFGGLSQRHSGQEEYFQQSKGGGEIRF